MSEAHFPRKLVRHAEANKGYILISRFHDFIQQRFLARNLCMAAAYTIYESFQTKKDRVRGQCIAFAR